MIVINFKNYKFGSQALKLAKKIQKYLPQAIIAIPSTEISPIAKKTRLKIYAQHVSPYKKGRATCFDLPQAIKIAGASGTLLNHSEHKISMKEIKEAINICHSLSLKTIVCTSNLQETKKILPMHPYAIAFEDPKLVGSGKSITKYKSKDVAKFSLLLKKTKIISLCGAGISSAKDINQARLLGCNGILISSAIANVKNPSFLLKQIASLKTK